MKMKKILVIGGTGFIGSNFLSYSKKKENINRYSLLTPTHKDLDILNKGRLEIFFSSFYPDVVINFSAHRNANSAEDQRNDLTGSAWQTNVLGVKNISEMVKKYKSFLIHISTDMVFSGREDNKGPYREDSKIETNIDVLSWYGWTKAEGERILTKNNNTAIIRIGNVTQPIYDPKLDYVGKILYLFDHKMLYPLFDDQYLTLTYIPSIFEAIEFLLEHKKKGIYHVASTNIFTPYQLATYLIKKARNNKQKIKKVSIDKYLKITPHRYPKFGGLLFEKTRKELHLTAHSWESIVDLFVEKETNQQ